MAAQLSVIKRIYAIDFSMEMHGFTALSISVSGVGLGLRAYFLRVSLAFRVNGFGWSTAATTTRT